MSSIPLPVFIALGSFVLIVVLFCFHYYKRSWAIGRHQVLGVILLSLGLGIFLLLTRSQDPSLLSEGLACERPELMKEELAVRRKKIEHCTKDCLDDLEAFSTLNSEYYRCTHGLNLKRIQLGEGPFPYRLEY